MVTKQQIITGLSHLGLKAGDVVIVHSSLSSFGEVEGGADTVIDALLEVIGDQGTLIVPTFNYDPGVFDIKETPSVVGRITETLRLRKDAVRSAHPTHSVAAIGRLAELITEDHDKVDPFAKDSALHKAAKVDAKILQLGVTQTSNSSIHVAEELAGVPYLDKQRRVGIKLANGKVIQKWIRRPGCSQGFEAVDELLCERDAIKERMIGECRARLMSARTVIETAVEMLRSDPAALLCDRPECGVCAEARAMIDATEAQNQEQMITQLAEEEERIRRQTEQQLSGNVSFFEVDRNDILSSN